MRKEHIIRVVSCSLHFDEAKIAHRCILPDEIWIEDNPTGERGRKTHCTHTTAGYYEHIISHFLLCCTLLFCRYIEQQCIIFNSTRSCHVGVAAYNLSQKIVFRGTLNGASWYNRGRTFRPLSDHEDPTDPRSFGRLSKHGNNDRVLSPLRRRYNA